MFIHPVLLKSLAGALGSAAVVIWKQRKTNQELWKHVQLQDTYIDIQRDRIAYLLQLFQEHDVPMSEFDAIALSDLFNINEND